MLQEYPLAKWNKQTEASTTMRALKRALVSVIMTLLNDSELSLNYKMAAPSNKQIKFPPSVRNQSEPPSYLQFKLFHFIYIFTQRNIHRYSKNRIWKYCVHSPSRKLIIVLVVILDFRSIYLSTWIASLRSERKHSIALRALALLKTPSCLCRYDIPSVVVMVSEPNLPLATCKVLGYLNKI